MALSDFVKTNTHGRIILGDGTGSPVTLSVAYDRGDFAFSGLSGPRLNEVTHHERRGKYLSSSYGARKYPQITFSGFLTGENSVGPGSIQAFLTQATPYTGNISTLGSGRVYAVSVLFTVEGTNFGDDADWSTLFNKCVPSDLSFGEGDADAFSFTLTVTGSITGSLSASEIP